MRILRDLSYWSRFFQLKGTGQTYDLLDTVQPVVALAGGGATTDLSQVVTSISPGSQFYFPTRTIERGVYSVRVAIRFIGTTLATDFCEIGFTSATIGAVPFIASNRINVPGAANSATIIVDYRITLDSGVTLAVNYVGAAGTSCEISGFYQLT